MKANVFLPESHVFYRHKCSWFCSLFFSFFFHFVMLLCFKTYSPFVFSFFFLHLPAEHILVYSKKVNLYVCLHKYINDHETHVNLVIRYIYAPFIQDVDIFIVAYSIPINFDFSVKVHYEVQGNMKIVQKRKKNSVIYNKIQKKNFFFFSLPWTL